MPAQMCFGATTLLAVEGTDRKVQCWRQRMHQAASRDWSRSNREKVGMGAVGPRQKECQSPRWGTWREKHFEKRVKLSFRQAEVCGGYLSGSVQWVAANLQQVQEKNLSGRKTPSSRW